MGQRMKRLGEVEDGLVADVVSVRTIDLEVLEPSDTAYQAARSASPTGRKTTSGDVPPVLGLIALTVLSGAGAARRTR